ncbi:MAG TPA: hypothetical protein ENN38_04185 [Actinobacteria bacterium]|nr:hypothetical protein [Actinomycetota bacterium]
MATKKYPSNNKVRYLRRSSRKKTLFKFVIPILLVVGLIYFVGQFGEGKSSEYQEYAIQINKLIRRSNETAKGFNELRMQTSIVSRAELKARLAQYYKDCADVKEDCALIRVPEELEKTHSCLELCFDMRARGMEDYQPAVFNALKDEDLEVASSQLSKALRRLALSDSAYGFFKEELEEFCKENSVDVSLLESEFLDDEFVYERTNVLAYLKQLKGTETLEITHGVAVVELSTNPKQTDFNSETKTAYLPGAENFVVVVTIENQGNQIENDIPVEATLKSEIEFEEQIKTARISSLAPGTREIITLQGLRPAGDGIVNLLVVTVGPLAGEKITTNNTREYKFVIR